MNLNSDTLSSRNEFYKNEKIMPKSYAAIENSLNYSVPSWPLQNTVAVNPFWNVRHEDYSKVMNDFAKVFKTSFFMPIEYYLEKLSTGEIKYEILKKHIPDNTSVERFIEIAKNYSKKKSNTISYLSEGEDWIINELGKFCASYFDEKQAIAKNPFRNEDFFSFWIESNQYDKSIKNYISNESFENSFQFISDIKKEDRQAAIQKLVSQFNIDDESETQYFLSCLVASMPGWASQFRYVEWQKALGYEIQKNAKIIDFLLVRLCYEYFFYSEISKKKTNKITLWKKTLSEESKKIDTDLREIFQIALEKSYQEKVSSYINKNIVLDEKSPFAQMVFCIDVRSESIRRNIEFIKDDIKTFGFAGFFGLPIDFESKKQFKESNRLPVLLKSGLKAVEVTDNSKDAIEDAGTKAFFKLLRKETLTSFLYVEMFGATYFFKFFKNIFKHYIFSKAKRQNSLPSKFKLSSSESSLKLFSLNGKELTDSDKVDKAESVLKNIGLIKNFAPIVMIVGHGSDNSPNSFGSSLDCGACGGNSGDVNARVVANLLNEPLVRKGLIKKDILIPETTKFVAAVHETVRDEIYFLDIDASEMNEDLKELKKLLAKASFATRNERISSKSTNVDLLAERRAINWSEVRPEWGLAGNACFVVARRYRTKGAELLSRSFLHEYDWHEDQKRNFSTLELIMTAPMVVTNWINMQYYASTVAPNKFGSGNKVIHNLVNESGVYEGNGGDLRVGLPIQSIHDGTKWIHDPLRLSVFIEAPKDAIMSIIEKHKTVKELFLNRWLYILRITEDGTVETLN